ncbi:hypothetical protein COUCH_17585 [Couchioplanes caeruleus]|uniref:hypothetical protein n=1 Tax=Couchioplanes caeruleus TaxID=56438 RepID=UPI0020BFC607|nr:hypothetical protein [Couchioplanes caeruleus]UQU67978.1 hypothetical protein COUCH_17585 [Couchioplanes caeruleus]
MRWFRRGSGRRQVEHDPGRQAALLQDLRQRFGPHVQARFPDQAAAVAALLEGDDGLVVADAVLREFADAAHADLLAQAADLYRRTGHPVTVDRRNYRPLWRAAGGALRWPLFALPGGLHPYIQVSGAVTAVGGQARRTVRVLDPYPLLGHLFEVLDLTVAGWEFGLVRVDTDAAALANGLITAARDLRAAMDDPPPLPPPVRELMRRNNTVDVYDLTANRIAGGFNPGRTMREQLLA